MTIYFPKNPSFEPPFGLSFCFEEAVEAYHIESIE
jgi:hypothetical protein